MDMTPTLLIFAGPAKSGKTTMISAFKYLCGDRGEDILEKLGAHNPLKYSAAINADREMPDIPLDSPLERSEINTLTAEALRALHPDNRFYVCEHSGYIENAAIRDIAVNGCNDIKIIPVFVKARRAIRSERIAANYGPLPDRKLLSMLSGGEHPFSDIPDDKAITLISDSVSDILPSMAELLKGIFEGTAS